MAGPTSIWPLEMQKSKLFLPSEPGDVGQVTVELGLDEVNELLLHERVQDLDEDAEAHDEYLISQIHRITCESILLTAANAVERP